MNYLIAPAPIPRVTWCCDPRYVPTTWSFVCAGCLCCCVWSCRRYRTFREEWGCSRQRRAGARVVLETRVVLCLFGGLATRAACQCERDEMYERGVGSRHVLSRTRFCRELCLYCVETAEIGDMQDEAYTLCNTYCLFPRRSTGRCVGVNTCTPEFPRPSIAYNKSPIFTGGHAKLEQRERGRRACAVNENLHTIYDYRITLHV